MTNFMFLHRRVHIHLEARRDALHIIHHHADVLQHGKRYSVCTYFIPTLQILVQNIDHSTTVTFIIRHFVSVTALKF